MTDEINNDPNAAFVELPEKSVRVSALFLKK
jgi:hypothetical protein